MMGHRESRYADRILIRSKDIGLIIGIITLGGLVWKIYAKPIEWDQTVKEMSEIKPTVLVHSIQLAVITDQLSTMNKHLESIDRKMGR